MLYNMKDLPDLYYYVDGGYIGKDRALRKFRYSYEAYTHDGYSHRIIATSALIDPYLLQALQSLDDMTIYVPAYVRPADSPNDEVLCYKYPNAMLMSAEYTTVADGDPAQYEYIFSSPTRELVRYEDLPQVIQDEIQ